MSDDSKRERARAAEEVARAAGQEAMSAAERAQAEAQRATEDARSEDSQQESLKQVGVIYGGLILIALYMVQPFLTARSLDTSATISVIAFAVAIPLLAALILVNRQELFRGRRTTSITVSVALSIAELAAFVGIVAGFWHISWVAGVTFLVAGLVGMGVHSAGWWRVESPREQAS